MNSRRYLYLAVLSGGSVLVYILISYFTYRIGFPLDDSWIHQTYARNLATYGEWAFIPGELSAGSTGPLWVAFLALGYFISLEPYLWSFLLGWLSLYGITIIGAIGFQMIFPRRAGWSIWLGILLSLEWHLVWAAASGMETIFFTFITTSILVRLVYLSKNVSLWSRNIWLVLGTLVGLSVWLRPDGITLLGPAGWVILFAGITWREKIRFGFFFSSGFLVILGFYLIFNLKTAGAWWPSTFYAKQAEYAVMRQIPIFNRILHQAIIPLVGVGVLLIPGFARQSYKGYKARNSGVLASILWITGYLIVYAWRLPVTYQHGRYLIPLMPIFFILGFAGLVSWIRPWSDEYIKRIPSRSWLLATGVVLLVFWLLGANSYGRDVAFIESEMVVTAKWIERNTPPEAVIAAHDIGALGYFGGHSILDMAGLISSEVIPFIRDEDRLEKYLNVHGADYLMTFPSWYPKLVQQKDVVYRTDGRYSLSIGGENMTVYILSLRQCKPDLLICCFSYAILDSDNPFGGCDSNIHQNPVN
jgi:hypothetical protein